MAALPGYVYDELPPDPPQLMTEEPIFVAFENIQVQLVPGLSQVTEVTEKNEVSRSETENPRQKNMSLFG